ncbi:MAG: HAMP domain-containing protein [Spirulinaceae cyanobacterium SM2_1_0]|nr:HAMP domain-containing protein [Spirulinaceae cyanobacterium SM2_1_0]
MQIWRKNLLVQLVSSFLILALAIVALVGYTAFAQARTALKQAAFEQLSVTVDLKAEELNRWLRDQHQLLQTVASLPMVEQAERILLDREADAAAQQRAYRELVATVSSLVAGQPGWQELFLLSPSRRILVSSQAEQRDRYQSLAQASVLASDGDRSVANVYRAPETGKPRITLATAIDASATPAFWAVHLDLARIDAIIRPPNAETASEIYLVSNLGNPLAPRYAFVRAAQFDDAEFADGITSAGIVAAMQGEDGRSLYDNYRGVPVVGVYQFLPQQDMALLAEAPQAIAFAPARHLALVILAVGGGLSVLLAIATVGLGRQIVQPVLAIAGAARMTSDRLQQRAVDDLPRVPVLARNELGTLAHAFNQLVAELQLTYAKLAESNRTLEIKVTERTQELAQNNERLALALHNLQRTQAQLIQTEKMASLGQLVAGVAHEINNPVGFIIGNLEPVRDYSRELLAFATAYKREPSPTSSELQQALNTLDLEFLRDDLPKALDSIAVGAQRIESIVNSLRVFSRLDEAECKPVDLHAGLDSTLLIVQHRLRKIAGHGAIAVAKQYAENLPLVECYASQLNQVWLSLLTNAIDALEGAVATQQITTPRLTIRTQTTVPGWLSVSIADNGTGMTAAVRDRVFDPFFTTKPVGKGTGLGLSMSYAIVVDRHQGRLTCRSQPGAGSEFIVEIPIRLSQE